MGSSVSIAELSAEDKSKLAKEMRIVLDKHLSDESMIEDLQKSVGLEWNRLIEENKFANVKVEVHDDKIKDNPSTLTELQHPLKTISVQEDVISPLTEQGGNFPSKIPQYRQPLRNLVGASPSKVGQSAKATRRRSFDASPYERKKSLTSRTVLPVVSIQKELLVESVSQASELVATETVSDSSKVDIVTEALPVAEIVENDNDKVATQNEDTPADSWDSVTHQPFCLVCQMAFKTDYILERHISYSQVHDSNMKRIKSGPMDPPEILVTPEPPFSPETEGVAYRLMYIGTKFFWRTQKSIDLRFYLHVLTNVLEVISFDPILDKEFNRVLLNYRFILNIVEDKIDPAIEKLRRETAADRFAIVPEAEELREDVRRSLIITYILQRLQLITELSASGHTIITALAFVKLVTDEDSEWYPLIDRAPSAFVPIFVAHRRHSNVNEINDAFEEIKKEREAIQQSASQAAKFSDATDVEVKQRKEWVDTQAGKEIVEPEVEEPHYAHPTAVTRVRNNSVGDTKRRPSV
eukprot:gene16997-23343_t